MPAQKKMQRWCAIINNITIANQTGAMIDALKKEIDECMDATKLDACNQEFFTNETDVQ